MFERTVFDTETDKRHCATSYGICSSCCERDLEMAVFVVVALAAFTDEIEHALAQLCKVHVRVRDQGDLW
jgi:hypothetical protein